MKVSELIQILNKHLETYGDKPIEVEIGYSCFDFTEYNLSKDSNNHFIIDYSTLEPKDIEE